MKLKIKNLSKKYTKDYIFRDFSYEFEDSGLYLVLGKSGSGKTTLMRLIAGLDKSYEGEIVGGGIENTSVAFQEYRLFDNLSALENVHLQRSDDCERAKEILGALGLSEVEWQQSPKNLSGGMKQRVSIARAIFKKSPILCLDEPTKEIGKDNVERLKNILKSEANERLVLVITHTEEDFFGLEYKTVSI